MSLFTRSTKSHYIDIIADTMNIYSLNINGIKERTEELETFLGHDEPDIVLLQEVKTRKSELKERLNYPGIFLFDCSTLY